ncbi:hypothetical protein WA026_018262 [Henosepilachna vigintioctopunctata]|uniref:Mediator of RNA polymerase II transcription subunit 26 n=1 Tax=Henosepilachna vigintioctopunctata TaxID=420089 RepID=A0AAW1VI92_9CUCU
MTIKKSKISESNNLSCTDELLINWIRKIDHKKDEFAKKDPNNLIVQNNIMDLKQRLIAAIDDNYMITDLSTVIDVIVILENMTFNRELLLTTRLGKHINKIRKKTENEKLSKRIRKLIEKWREAILSNDSESNGNNDVPTHFC